MPSATAQAITAIATAVIPENEGVMDVSMTWVSVLRKNMLGRFGMVWYLEVHMKKTPIFLGIIALIVAGVWYWYTVTAQPADGTVVTNTPPSDTIPIHVPTSDEHLVIDETLRDVNFCGKTYKVKQIKIDGVDVVQRIAELATKDQSNPAKKEVCALLENYRIHGMLKNQVEINTTGVVRTSIDGVDFYKVSIVPDVNSQHIGDFKVNLSTGDIVIELQGFDGSMDELFGTLSM